MRSGDASQLALGQLEEAVHAVVDVGALGGGRRLLAREDLGHIGLGNTRGAGEVPLVQVQLVQPLPYHQGDIHLNQLR